MSHYRPFGIWSHVPILRTPPLYEGFHFGTLWTNRKHSLIKSDNGQNRPPSHLSTHPIRKTTIKPSRVLSYVLCWVTRLISASSFGFLEETELTYGSYFHASNLESVLRFHVECTGLLGATVIGLFDVTVQYINTDSIVDLSCSVCMMSQSNRHLYWFHFRCVWLVDPRPWWAFQDTLGVRNLKRNVVSEERPWLSSFKTVRSILFNRATPSSAWCRMVASWSGRTPCCNLLCARKCSLNS